jgi:site-specific recombinase XerD
MSQDLKDLKTQFLEYLEIEKGRAVKTSENYDRYLSTFLDHTKLSDPAQITETIVRALLGLARQHPGDAGHLEGLLAPRLRDDLLKIRAAHRPRREAGCER